jgi:uncharacterized coiled-coil protein SlyX
MTSTESSKVKDKLNDLRLVNEEDYTRADICERGKSGAQIHKHYNLTPDAFKKCLMRAQRRANQPVDPVVYVDYYLLLEKIIKLYNDYQSGYLKKVLSTKDAKIDELIKQNNVQNQKIDAQSAQIAELLGYAKDTRDTLDEVQDELAETKNTLDDVQDDLTETKEDVKIAKKHLIEKSKVSTRNPKSENKHHRFVVTVVNLKDGWRKAVLTTGTKAYVAKTIAKNVVEQGHKIVIPEFYTANGFDLRQNCLTEFNKFLKQRLMEINKRNAEADFKFNEPLKAEIRAHNRNHAGNKRSFVNEKRKTKTIKPKDIPIDYTVRWFKYRTNPYVSFDDVLQVVIDTNAATQKSPLADAE